MQRQIFTLNTLPNQPTPDRLLLFIQQAQLTIYYQEETERPVPQREVISAERGGRRH